MMIIIILEDTLEQRPSGFVQLPLYKAYYVDDDDNWAMLAKSEDRNHFPKNKSTPVVMAAMTVDATAKARKVRRRRASQPSDSPFICGRTTMQMILICSLLLSSLLAPSLYWTMDNMSQWRVDECDNYLKLRSAFMVAQLRMKTWYFLLLVCICFYYNASPIV